VSLTLAATGFSASHDVPADEYEPGLPTAAQAHRHSTRSLFGDATLDASLGVAKRWAIEASLPMRGVQQTTTYTGASGEILPGFVSIHHQDGALAGVGDVALLGRWRAVAPDRTLPLRLDLRAGVTLPTGGIEPDPEQLGREGKAHQHLFFGSGTVDPVLGFDAGYDLQNLRIVGYGQARASLYDNRLGYRQGARAGGGLGVDFAAGLTGWRFLVQPELTHEEVSRWGADLAENSGRTDVLVTLGVTWMPAPRWFVQARAKVPIHTWTEQGDLTVPWFGLLSVGHAVELY
jgi:hypothetical protein